MCVEMIFSVFVLLQRAQCKVSTATGSSVVTSHKTSTSPSRSKALQKKDSKKSSSNHNNNNNNIIEETTPYVKLVQTVAALARGTCRSDQTAPRRSESFHRASGDEQNTNGLDKERTISKDAIVRVDDPSKIEVKAKCLELDTCIGKTNIGLLQGSSFDQSQLKPASPNSPLVDGLTTNVESNGKLPDESVSTGGSRLSSTAQMMCCFAPRPYGMAPASVTAHRPSSTSPAGLTVDRQTDSLSVSTNATSTQLSKPLTDAAVRTTATTAVASLSAAVATVAASPSTSLATGIGKTATSSSLSTSAASVAKVTVASASGADGLVTSISPVRVPANDVSRVVSKTTLATTTVTTNHVTKTCAARIQSSVTSPVSGLTATTVTVSSATATGKLSNTSSVSAKNNDKVVASSNQKTTSSTASSAKSPVRASTVMSSSTKVVVSGGGVTEAAIATTSATKTVSVTTGNLSKPLFVYSTTRVAVTTQATAATVLTATTAARPATVVVGSCLSSKPISSIQTNSSQPPVSDIVDGMTSSTATTTSKLSKSSAVTSSPELSLAAAVSVSSADVIASTTAESVLSDRMIDTSSDSVSTALSVLMNSANSSPTTTTSVSGETPTSPKSAYRCLSRNAASGIYRRKLGLSSLDQYTRNMDQLYGGGNEFFGTMSSSVDSVTSPLSCRSPSVASPVMTSSLVLSSPTLGETSPDVQGSMHKKSLTRPKVPPPPPPPTPPSSEIDAQNPLTAELQKLDLSNKGLLAALDGVVEAVGTSRPRSTAPHIARRAFLYGDVSSPSDEFKLFEEPCGESATVTVAVSSSPPASEILNSSSSAYRPPAEISALYIDDDDLQGGNLRRSVTSLRQSVGRMRGKRKSEKQTKSVTFDPCSLLLSATITGELDIILGAASQVCQSARAAIALCL